MDGSLNVLAREGEYWTVVFGGRVSRVRDTKGLHYLEHLLRHPGEEVHALALVALVDPPPRPAPVGRMTGDAGPVLDGQAVAAYRARFRDLRGELAEAEASADLARIGRAQDELDALTEQLAGGLGLGGRH
ncbi:MAG: transcriptional regulator, partial [Acidimicrobiales bacterium]